MPWKTTYILPLDQLEICESSVTPDTEWRVVHINPDRDEYPVTPDERNRSIISMRFDPSEYVKELWVGPHDNQAACLDAIKEVVRTNAPGCKVKTSKQDAVSGCRISPAS
jgi:hypothetical protein